MYIYIYIYVMYTVYMCIYIHIHNNYNIIEHTVRTCNRNCKDLVFGKNPPSQHRTCTTTTTPNNTHNHDTQ